jgi:hypothetical protein
MNIWQQVIEKTGNRFEVKYLTNQEFFDNPQPWLKNGMPFIVHNYTAAHSTEYIFEKIKQYFGNVQLRARHFKSQQDYLLNRSYEKIDIAEYLVKLDKGDFTSLPYAANNMINIDLADALGACSPMSRFNDQLRPPRIWIGPAGSTTPLHKDSTDNFAIHLYGEKKWFLFSIAEAEFLHFAKTKYGNYDNPQADFRVSTIESDISALPIRKIELNLSAGDFLYVPFGWGHAVQNHTPTIMINYWFKLSGYKPLFLR